MPRAKITIRKYPDRRLYDTAASRYVKLEDVAEMIREGNEVEVLDARTGKDITRVILTQIVMEDARDREAGLPLQLLRQLVVASDRATHEFVSWYLNSTLSLYQKAQEALHSGVSEARQAVTSPVEFVRHLLAGHSWPPAREPDEVERLRNRVQELEAQLAAVAMPARKPAARKNRGGRKRGGKSETGA